MPRVNAKAKDPRRKTLYFNGETAQLLKERALEEHRSESNYLQHLILQDNRARKTPAAPLEEIQHREKNGVG